MRQTRLRVLAIGAVVLGAVLGCQDIQPTAPRPLPPRPILLPGDPPTVFPSGPPLTIGPTAINDEGTIVGANSDYSQGYQTTTAFIQRPGQAMEDLGSLGDRYTVPLAINNSRQVVGSGWVPVEGNGAFFWENGQMRRLPSLYGRSTYAVSINSHGHAVGYSAYEVSEEIGGEWYVTESFYRAALWRDGQVTDLGGPRGPSYALDINDNDEIAGFHITVIDGVQVGDARPFVWKNGLMTDLPLPPGRGGAYAFAINASGQVAGFVWTGSFAGVRATVWTNGQPRELGTLGGSASWAYAIDDAGRVYGNSYLPGDTEMHAFIWTPSDGMEDIGAASGMTEVHPRGVNNNLQVVGHRYTGDGYNIGMVYRVPFQPTPNTTVGTNVGVGPPDARTGGYTPIVLEFQQITGAGLTTATVSTIGAPESPPAPNGFQLGNPATFYNIETTATFVGAISICIDYGGVTYGVESELRLLHYADGMWTDATLPGYPDEATKQICGQTTSLSPFVVADVNYVPVVTSTTLPSSPIAVGSSVTLTASFTDKDRSDLHTARVAWGDGAITVASLTEASGSGSISATHVYESAGVYTVTVTTSDGNLAGTRSSAQDVPAYVVVYDASGGFVTGGGWINSPAGALTANPGSAGKATFGFVSRYQKGASVPSGNTQFSFVAGDLKFESTNYDWLVIAGARAQYKGSGKVNGRGDYSFLLTAVDGQVEGGGGLDMFRLKIVDKSTSSVVYDNEKGVSDTERPGTKLAGGGIVIHR